MATMVQDTAQALKSFDFYKFDDYLTEKQRATRDRVREFVQNVVLPNINPYWDKAEFPWEIAMQLKDLGIIGGPLMTHGAPGLDFVEMGLVIYELAKGDGSIGTFYGVHSGLALGSIGLLGSEEQKDRWLPDMVQLKKIGAFALTEPNVGSNAVGIETTARRDGDSYILNGAKRWIGNASIADLIIIWARDEDGKFGGFVIEDPKSVAGLTITDIQGKIGKRGVLNADIVLDNVRIPAENRLENVTSFKHTAQVLGMGRYGVAWEAAGIAAGAFEHALKYSLEREQFGKPIASFQLIQQKLVEMATEVTLMHSLCWQLSQLISKWQMTEGIVSMAKYNNARKARYVTQLARELMGGNGILIENHVARLWTDAEVVYTYEGTNEVNLLIVGRELTGISAII
jgi:glutaryl-CoA dehydrogenase